MKYRLNLLREFAEAGTSIIMHAPNHQILALLVVQHT